MFPSKTPLIFILQVLVVWTSVIAALIVGGVILKNPMALLALLGLFFMPQFPLLEKDEEEVPESEYEGVTGAGFGLPDKD